MRLMGWGFAMWRIFEGTIHPPDVGMVNLAICLIGSGFSLPHNKHFVDEASMFGMFFGVMALDLF